MPVNQVEDMAEKVSGSVKVQALHQILTLIGIPILLAVSGYGLTTLVQLQVEVARFNEAIPRLNRLEDWRNEVAADALQHPRFDTRDAASMEARLSTRITEGDKAVVGRLEQFIRNLKQ